MKPRIIKTESEYDQALSRIETLMGTAPGSEEERELELFLVLVERYEAEHYPVPLPDPIEAIKFRMEQLDLKQRDLAPYFGSASKVSEVLNGKRKLSLSMIRKLHAGLGIPAEVLLQDPESSAVETCQFAVAEYPFSIMYRRGYFGDTDETLSEAKVYGEERLESLFSVFGNSAVQPIYCRATAGPVDMRAISAWQARVLHLVQGVAVPSFSGFRFGVDSLRPISQLSFLDEGPLLVGEYLRKKGIHLVILPHLPKTRLDGACFCAPSGNPVIALTLRHDRLDNFWFTLMHELGHLCLHLCSSTDLSSAYFDEINPRATDESSPIEAEANAFARDALVAPDVWQSWHCRLTDGASIRHFAAQIGISSAIVAGRVRWETQNYRLHSSMAKGGGVRHLFWGDMA